MKEEFKKEYNITGKDLTSEKKEAASVYLNKIKQEMIEPIEGEYIKSQEELRPITRTTEITTFRVSFKNS